MIITIYKPALFFIIFFSHFKATGSGSRQLPAGDNVGECEELCEIARAFEMKPENFGQHKEMREKLHEHIKERRQESRKASLAQYRGIRGTVHV